MPWEDYIPDFVTLLAAKECPVEGMFGMVDGHFQPCCRPGGLGCINDNLLDYQMFNGNPCLPQRDTCCCPHCVCQCCATHSHWLGVWT